MINLTLATPSDIRSVSSMMESFYSIDQYPFDQTSAERLLDHFIKNPLLGRLWLIQQNHKNIGYLAMTLGFSFEYGGRDALIDEFFINEAYRNKGIGTKCLELLGKEAIKLNINAIHLEVERSNQVGQKLYKKQGFIDNDRALLSKYLKPTNRY